MWSLLKQKYLSGGSKAAEGEDSDDDDDDDDDDDLTVSESV